MLIGIKMKQNLFTELCHSDHFKKFTSTLAKFMSALVFKFIQMTYSCSMARLQGFRKIKFGLLGNQIWPL